MTSSAHADAPTPQPESQFLRRNAGVMRFVALPFAVVATPLLLLAPVPFATDGRWAWATVFALLASVWVAALVSLALVGYRIDALGIASRQSVPLRFTDTMKWDDVAVITWGASIIPYWADNCTIWCSGSTKPVRLRKLIEQHSPRASVLEVRQHEELHGMLTPMLITLTTLSRPNRRRLLAAFEQQGFAPLPQHRREYNTTISWPRAS